MLARGCQSAQLNQVGFFPLISCPLHRNALANYLRWRIHSCFYTVLHDWVKQPLLEIVQLKSFVCSFYALFATNAFLYRRSSIGHDGQPQYIKLCPKMYVKNTLIHRNIHRFHRHPQRTRCSGIIQTTRIVHQLIKCRYDLVCLRIIHSPHRPDDGKSSKLHCRCEMYNLVRTLLVSNRRMTSRQVRKL